MIVGMDKYDEGRVLLERENFRCEISIVRQYHPAAIVSKKQIPYTHNRFFLLPEYV